MKTKDLERAVEIKKQLKELEYFTKQINSRWEETKMIIKQKRTIKYSILGIRSFATDSHIKEIKVPQNLIIYIDIKALDLKKQLEEELEKL